MRALLPSALFSSAAILACASPAFAITTMRDAFPEVFAHGNLSEIRWDHAVNSKELLAAALANDKQMIEADVLVGHLANTPLKTRSVIMGHPPAGTSNLSLEDFLAAVVEDNKKGVRKGVKLDFKTSEAFALSSKVLLTDDADAFRGAYTSFPLWINADVAVGPASQQENNGVDLQLDVVREKLAIANAATWSLGWTTGDFQPDVGYTLQQVDAMRELAQGIPNVTFPVRAVYAAKSHAAMAALLDIGTLTIWSAQQDDAHVDVPELAKLIANNLDKVYVDVPEPLERRIQAALPKFR